MGYFNDALPDSHLSQLDNHFIKNYRESWVSTALLPWLRKKWQGVKSSISKTKIVETPHVLPREKRTEALTKFILSLSDQQLVTGLAILTSALRNTCRITVFEFNVVVNLAWFSSAVHLATLGVLRKYFIEHQVVRNFRVVGMLSLMALLLFSLITNYMSSSGPQAVSLQCWLDHFYEGASISNFSAYPNSSYSVSNSSQPEPSASFSFSLMILATTVILVGTVLSTYVSKATALYTDMTSSLFLDLRVSIWRLKRKYPRLPEEDMNKIWQRLQNESLERFYKKHIIAVETADPNPTRLSKLRRIRSLLSLVCVEYSRSYMSEIPQLGFEMAFGITRVLESRYFGTPLLVPSSSRMDFGQIVPLFFLALPVLVAVETYYGMRKSDLSQLTYPQILTRSRMSRLL